MAVLFDGKCEASVVSPGKGKFEKDSLVAVVPTSVQVDTARFKSRDFLSSQREGFVEVNINDNTVILPFKGKGALDAKYLDKMLFLGMNPGRLGVRLRVVESDQEVRSLFDRIGSLLEKVAQSPLAGFHPAIAPGLGWFAGLLDFLEQQVKDDVEFQGFLVFDVDSKSYRPGARTELQAFRRPGDQQPVLTVAWEVVDLGQVTISNNLSVRLRDLAFTPVLAKRARVQVPLRYVRSSKKRPMQSLQPAEYLRQIGLSLFNCEASSKSKKFTYSTRYALKQSAEHVNWQSAELFVVKAGRGTAKATRHFIPFNLSLFLSRDNFDLQSLLDLGPGALEVARQLGVKTDDLRVVMQKALPAVSALVAETSAEAVSLYHFDGVLFLDPPGRGVLSRARNGVLPLQRSKDAPVWTTEVAQPVNIRGQSVGQLSFTLEVREI